MGTLTIYRNETKTWAGAATDNGAVLDLTGAVLYFVARRDYPPVATTSDADAEISLSSVTSAIVVTGAAAGLYTLTVTKANIAAIEPGQLHYSVAAVLGGATDPVVLDAGTLTIHQNARAA